MSIKQIRTLNEMSKYGPFSVHLRATQEVCKLVDVFNGVFERLYLGQGLPSFAVVRRQVVPKLVQSLCEAPHPHLLPLAGLHASFGGHLWLALPLRRWCSHFSAREGEGEVFDLPMLAGVAHLRWRAHWLSLWLRWSGLRWLLVFSKGALMALPLRQYFSCNHIQVHVGYPGDQAATDGIQGFGRESVWKWFGQSGFIQKLISGGLKVHSCSDKSSKKLASAKMRPSRRTWFVSLSLGCE